MTTEPMTLPIRPAPLREVLDAGGNPRTILGDDDFEHRCVRGAPVSYIGRARECWGCRGRRGRVAIPSPPGPATPKKKWHPKMPQA